MPQYSLLTIISYLIGPTLIIVCHIGSLLTIFTGVSWGAIAWIVGLYWLRMLGTTAIYHRLLTHKSYQAPKIVLWIGCVITASAGQMGPSWWKAHHLSHHQNSDQVLDVHSPRHPALGGGWYWSQGGWLLSSQFFPDKLPADVEGDRFLQILDRLHFLPLVGLGVLSYQMGGWEYLGALCLSTTLLFHGVQTVNSLSHISGEQPFVTDDFSRNNGLVAFLTLGEGWHNLHHAFQYSARHGITLRDRQVVYLPDPTFSFIKLLESLNLASKLKLPSESMLLAKANHQLSPELAYGKKS